MEAIQILQKAELLGKEITVYGTVENPLFLAKDVAEWIDYNKNKKGSYDVSQMLDTVDADEKIKIFCSLPSRYNSPKPCVSATYTGANRWFVTEGGLYEIFMQSTKPIAKQYKKGVKEILKSVRKHGAYITPQKIDEILSDPDLIIQLAIQLKEERKKGILLEGQNHVYQSENRRLLNVTHQNRKIIELQTPKVEYADNILNSATTYTTTQIAKELGLSAQYLNFTLKSHGVIEKKGGIWTATETYVGKGYLTVKSYPYRGSSNRERTNFGTVWTEAGRKFIHSLIGKGTLPFK